MKGMCFERIEAACPGGAAACMRMQTTYLRFQQYELRDAPRDAFIVAVTAGGKAVDMALLRRQWGLAAASAEHTELNVKASLT